MSTNRSKLEKVFTILFSAMVGIFLVLGIICLIDWFEWKSDPIGYEPTPFTNIAGTGFLVLLYVLLAALFSVVAYALIMRLMAKKTSQVQETVIEPILIGAANKHDAQLIELLKSVARPMPGDTKLNRARTTHFLCAMRDLELIDRNLDGKHLMSWVVRETGYSEKSLSDFNQALNNTSSQDSKVIELKKQIEQIISA
jgi:hypothetical protein